MSSKNNVLNRIKNIELEKISLPEIPEFEVAEDIISTFQKSLEANHTEVFFSNGDIEEVLKPLLKNYKNIASGITGLSLSTLLPAEFSIKEKINEIEAFIVEGNIGSGENGAIWIPEENAIKRALPFITLHLFVVIKKTDIVGNMHQAYNRINQIPGFGVFVAGPSKTADIEQSLVVGAHGPKKMTVLITE